MGQDCTKCCKTLDLEDKIELEISPERKKQHEQMFKNTETVTTQESTKSIDNEGKFGGRSMEEMMVIIRVQSMIRGWIQRRKYRVQQI